MGSTKVLITKNGILQEQTGGNQGGLDIRVPVNFNGQSASDLALDALRAEQEVIAAQANWYIDPINGNDSFTGVTATTALRTHAELMRRFNGIIVTAYPSIHILNDITTEDINIDVKLGAASMGAVGGLFYTGLLTPIRSGTFTSVTNFTASLNVSGSIVDTNLPAGSWTQANCTGSLVLVTGGARANTTFWITKDHGSSKRASISQPLSNVGGFGFDATAGVISTGDPYTVYRLTKFGNLVNTDVHGTAGAQINFQYLDVGVHDTIHVTETARGFAWHDSCQLNGPDVNNSSQVEFSNCYLTNGLRVDQSSYAVIAAGYSTNSVQSRFGAMMTCIDHVVEGAGVAVTPTSQLDVPSGNYLAIFNTTTGLTVHGGSTANYSCGRIWGLNVSAIGAQVINGGKLYWASGSLNIQNPSNKVVIGGVAKTYEQLPFINLTGSLAAVLTVA